jgi:hypothetical protein
VAWLPSPIVSVDETTAPTDDAATDDAVRLAIMRKFVDESRPPAPNELASMVGMPQAGVEASLRRLADAHVIVLAPGTPLVWMANPFSALPTPFEVRSGNQRWWGNCIWDALGILATTGTDGEVRTSCPDCGEPLRLEVRDGGIGGDAGVVHYATPAAQWWDDIGST